MKLILISHFNSTTLTLILEVTSANFHVYLLCN